MATALLSQAELLDIFFVELQTLAPQLTDTLEGSIDDVLGGVFTSGTREIELLITDLFRKTFFDSAEGPDENNDGDDDLQTLAVDHFGSAFARPSASFAIGVVAFSRPAATGPVLIKAGTIVKTGINSNGVAQRFQTLIDVTLSNLTVNASVVAITAGSNGNAEIGEVSVIETALTDPTIIVTNAAKFSGGAPAMDSPTYRQYIRNLIEAIKGATVAAIQAKALTVAGVVTATVVETEKVVIEWNIGSSSPIGTYFRIPFCTLYIADANGTANQALIDAVRSAVDLVRACGVLINYAGASAFSLNWTGAITLNPSGPNFTALSADPSPIIATMKDYMGALKIGDGFIVADANAAMLAIWGSAGTNDLTAFTTPSPSGDVAGTAGVKIIPGTVAIGTC